MPLRHAKVELVNSWLTNSPLARSASGNAPQPPAPAPALPRRPAVTSPLASPPPSPAAVRRRCPGGRSSPRRRPHRHPHRPRRHRRCPGGRRSPRRRPHRHPHRPRRHRRCPGGRRSTTPPASPPSSPAPPSPALPRRPPLTTPPASPPPSPARRSPALPRRPLLTTPPASPPPSPARRPPALPRRPLLTTPPASPPPSPAAVRWPCPAAGPHHAAGATTALTGRRSPFAGTPHRSRPRLPSPVAVRRRPQHRRTDLQPNHARTPHVRRILAALLAPLALAGCAHTDTKLTRTNAQTARTKTAPSHLAFPLPPRSHLTSRAQQLRGPRVMSAEHTHGRTLTMYGTAKRAQPHPRRRLRQRHDLRRNRRRQRRPDGLPAARRRTVALRRRWTRAAPTSTPRPTTPVHKRSARRQPTCAPRSRSCSAPAPHHASTPPAPAQRKAAASPASHACPFSATQSEGLAAWAATARPGTAGITVELPPGRASKRQATRIAYAIDRLAGTRFAEGAREDRLRLIALGEDPRDSRH